MMFCRSQHQNCSVKHRKMSSQFCFEHQVTVFSHFPLSPAWRHLQTWKKTFESYAGQLLSFS
jgi:hypothetical protein